MTKSTPPSPSPHSALHNPLWHFSLDFYGYTGVADFLLECQDRRGADVCLLLWASYAAFRRHRLSEETWQVADRSLAPRRRIIVSVRRLRRWLGYLRPYTRGVYEYCKRYEQKLEQRQLAILWRLRKEQWAGGRSPLELAAQHYGLPHREQARWADLIESYKTSRA